MRVLIVEDDERIAAFVENGLKDAGFGVDCADNGEDGLHMALTADYDAAVVDIMLPGLDGLNLISALRQRGNSTPVLVLSARTSVDDRVTGLQRGADDYLVKPFIFAELLARIQALVRRGTKSIEANRLVCGDLSVDVLQREVRRGGAVIDLQPREYALLAYLLRNRGRTVSKTMILEHIWGVHFDPQTNVVDVLVCRLRNKIDKDFPDKLIHTTRGIGYAIKAPHAQSH